jgi:HK97 family phage major capsid protein
VPYDNVIDRTNAGALIPEDVSREIWQLMPEKSAALARFRTVRMSRKQQRLPVLSVLPVAYWVNGDTGLKQTSEQNWANKYLDAEELAVIVPIPEAVLDDQDYDIWGEIKPRVAEAIALALDSAVFIGTNKPASWPSAIVTAATAAANTVARGTTAAAAGGVAGDINLLMQTVEADGFEADGFVARKSMKGVLRGARATDGQKLIDISTTEIEGAPVQYTTNAVWPAPATGAAEMIAGDWSHGIIGVRQDITYKMLDQAVIQDNTGAIIYNLPQQDMIAMRAVFRVAFQVPNPVSIDRPVEAQRYPFAVLTQP